VPTSVSCAPAPADDVQRSSASGFSAQPTSEWRRFLSSRHIAGRLQVGIRPIARPATDNAQFHFVPRTSVWSTIVIAHHHPIRFNDQHARRWLVRQFVWRLLSGVHLRDRAPLPTFKFSPYSLGMRAQRLTAVSLERDPPNRDITL
jgi:hypothetical protein